MYRRDRLKQRGTGIKGQYLPPTIDQLQQIAQLLNQKANRTFSPEAIMTKLQNTAERLRQYRIYARGGTPATKSINEPETQSAVDRLQSSSMNDSGDRDEQTEFLTIETERLSIRDAGRIEASVFGEGGGGDMLIEARDLVEVVGTDESDSPSFLGADVSPRK